MNSQSTTELEAAQWKLSDIILLRSEKAFRFFRYNPGKSLEVVIYFWEANLLDSSIDFLLDRGFKGHNGKQYYGYCPLREDTHLHSSWFGTVTKPELIEILAYFEQPEQHEAEQWIVLVTPFDFIEYIVES